MISRMKNFRFLLISVFVLVGFSSCGLMKSTSTTRTARTIEIKADIQQMPTVADLVVDTVLAKNDTSWTNISFKHMMLKSEMRKVLLGEMLENTDADVIVQPREKVQTKVYHPFKQSYTMQVVGYPARYRNFRTATEEDLRILQGLDPQPVNYNTIYIGAGSDYKEKTISAGDMTKAVTPKKPVKAKKPPYLRNPFIVGLELGYYTDPIRFMSGGHGFTFQNTYLWRTKNQNIYLGLGWGMEMAFGQYDNDNDARPINIPLYFDTRFYFGKKKVIPFFELRLGADFLIDYFNHNNDWARNSDLDYGLGMHYGGFFGLEFGRHVNISVGTTGLLVGMLGYRGDGAAFGQSITAKLGFAF